MLQTAIRAARAGGRELVRRFALPHKIHETREHNTIVTEADLKSERAIIKVIQEKYPDHNILAEEKGFVDKKSEYTWVIDPLDGSSNYNSEIPFFNVAVGLLRGAEIILGVVYEPIRRDTFCAEKGKGAFLNHKPIEVSDNPALRKTILITAGKTFLMHKVLKAMEGISEKVRTVRILGSGALEICYVACGRIDALLKPNEGVWDFLAASIILEEAGGRLTNFKGERPVIKLDSKEKIPILATNARIPHNKILEALK